MFVVGEKKKEKNCKKREEGLDYGYELHGRFSMSTLPYSDITKPHVSFHLRT
jgi:hypothetical protein